MKKAIASLLIALVPSASFAKHWNEWIVEGQCNKANVHLVENGDSLSVLYDELGVNMPQGKPGDGNDGKRVCHFRIVIVPPPGTYLAHITQTFAGGLIKSAKSSARMDIRYRIGDLKEKPGAIEWKHGTAVAPEDPASIFTRTFDEEIPVAGCPAKTRYQVTLVVAAKRKDASEFVIAGWDSFDTDFIHRVIVTPVFRRCR